MSTPIITGGAAPVTIPAGDIQFYDRFSPPLPAGNYTLSTSQSVGGVQNINDGVEPVYQAPDQPLLITGPRFSLSGKDVYSMYPPPGNIGTFQDHLPQVVLTQKSFPWTRSIVDISVTPSPSPAPTASTPWIGILTFYPGDVQTTGQQLNPTSGPYVSLPKTLNVPDVVTGSSTVLAPQIKPTTTENSEQAVVVEMAYSYFKSIAPSQTDLPYLAHGRQVNTSGKALAGEQAQGYFSVAVGNRVVQPNTSTVPAPVQTAVLVSLEGQWNRLPGGSDASNPANDNMTIRLVVLASWTFGALPAGGDFLYLMSQLNVDLLRLPSGGPTANPDSDPAAQAVEALALGYVPLGNDLRDGENTTSYYRGPGAAAPCVTDTTYGPYHYSDSTVHYDPTFGTFNLTYAAAFQVGRLLALSDGSFCQSLIQWRNDYFFRLQNTLKQQAVQGALDQAVTAAAMPAALAASDAGEYGPPDQMKTTVRKFWHGVVGAPLFSGKGAKVPLVQARHRRAASAARPGVLSSEEIEAMHAAGEDPVQALRRKIASLNSPESQP